MKNILLRFVCIFITAGSTLLSVAQIRTIGDSSLKVTSVPTTQILSNTGTGPVEGVMSFSKTRPTVVVLIHGVTGYPTTDPRIGTLKGARNYWGYDFIYGLLGATTDRPTTFAADNAASMLGKPDWETRFINDDQPSHHFITIYGKPNPSQNFYTPFSLMLTYRNGSESLRKQVSNTAAQIVELYNSMFASWPEAKKPQLVLMCHSFGGLVARTICSMPSNVPSRDPLIPSENFTTTDRENMQFIRDRTMYLVTLATPHEGSPITWNAAMGTVMQHLPFIGEEIDRSDPDTKIIRQMSVPFVDNLNKTILAPEKCKRSNGALIPIHALGGRVPAGPEYFSDPNKSDNDLTTIDGGVGTANIESLNSSESNREVFESYNLVRVDYAMHLFFGVQPLIKPWGPTPSDNAKLDIVKIIDVQPLTGCLTPPIYNLASFGAKPRLFYLRNDWDNVPGSVAGVTVPCSGKFTKNAKTSTSDGEIDSDGFVPINSSLGVKLGTATKDYYDHTRDGSWYRFYRSVADFHNHGSIKFKDEIGEWLRVNIIGNTPSALLFGTLNRFDAAGPNVSPTGTVSTW